MEQEHYEAQGKYADMLFEMLKVPKWKLIKRFKLFLKAEEFRNKHKSCCYWANEDD